MVNRRIEEEVVPLCKSKNIGILAYSPLQRGLLTGKIKPGHHFNEGDNRPTTPYYKEPNLTNILKLVEKMQPVADNHKATIAQVVLNWTMNRPGITCVLAGARNPGQVLDNAGAVSFRLQEDEVGLIDKLLEDFTLIAKV